MEFQKAGDVSLPSFVPHRSTKDVGKVAHLFPFSPESKPLSAGYFDPSYHTFQPKFRPNLHPEESLHRYLRYRREYYSSSRTADLSVTCTYPIGLAHGTAFSLVSEISSL